jgi:hypothetical protein
MRRFKLISRAIFGRSIGENAAGQHQSDGSNGTAKVAKTMRQDIQFPLDGWPNGAPQPANPDPRSLFNRGVACRFQVFEKNVAGTMDGSFPIPARRPPRRLVSVSLREFRGLPGAGRGRESGWRSAVGYATGFVPI